jgi:hypothetical protein
MYNPKNVFGMEEVKVHKDKGVHPCKDAPSQDMSGVKTSGTHDARVWRSD